MMRELVAIAALASTWAMVGLIWMVQVVHYPMLARFSAGAPAVAAGMHQRSISFVVGPLMAVEGITALVLLGFRPATIGAPAAWVAAVLLAVALVSTITVQVPLHGRLAQRHDEDVARRLITTNWVRTIAWSGRGLLLAAAVVS